MKILTCLMHSLSSACMIDEEGLSALSWRTKTAGMINSLSTLNLCGICYPSWIPTNMWDSFENPQRAGWYHHKNSLDDLWASWESREWVPGWLQTLSQFSKRAGRRTLETTGLPVPGKMEKFILGGIERSMHVSATANMASRGEGPACGTSFPSTTG